MARTYRRSDGFTCIDLEGRPIEWAVETYGGEMTDWSEGLPPAPPTEDELRIKAIDAELAVIDQKFGVRPVRTDLIARWVLQDNGKTVEAEAQAVALRAERASLIN
jgi:hypothetical protein